MFASNFEQEERSFRTRKNSLALFITVSVHAIILLILFFTILHTPDPPFEDSAGGMAVNFGFDETGSGEEQPMSYDPGPMTNTAPAAAASIRLVCGFSVVISARSFFGVSVSGKIILAINDKTEVFNRDKLQWFMFSNRCYHAITRRR